MIKNAAGKFWLAIFVTVFFLSACEQKPPITIPFDPNIELENYYKQTLDIYGYLCLPNKISTSQYIDYYTLYITKDSKTCADYSKDRFSYGGPPDSLYFHIEFGDENNQIKELGDNYSSKDLLIKDSNGEIFQGEGFATLRLYVKKTVYQGNTSYFLEFITINP